MLKNFEPFDIFIGFVAMLCGLISLALVVAMLEANFLHWFILGVIACYYLGKFIRERMGL